MQIQSQSAASQTLAFLLTKFSQQLKIKQLSKLIPQYNASYVSKMADAGVGTAYMAQPLLRHTFAYNEMNQDRFPEGIGLDQFANFQVEVQVRVGSQSPIFRDKIQAGNSKQSNRYRKTGSTFRATPTPKPNQSHQSQLQKYLQIPENTNTALHELPSSPPTKQQIDLEYELRAMQKKLYYTRKAKKQEQQKEEERLRMLRKRKSPELPRTDFTYESNGMFLRRKVFKSDALLVDEIKHSQSFDLRPKDKKSLDELLEQSEQPHPRSQLNSRLQKSTLFNNANKRQVSHLPFIKLSDNAKIREDNRNGEGSKTERVSLQAFTEGLEERSFRHYSEIERERKERELLAKLQARRLQNKQQQQGKNPEQPSDNNPNSIKRRQSYLMNKYLKKLKEQADNQPRKSLNFHRVSFPKNTAIHSYYKHDFNEERKFYESEVISRVIGDSGQRRYGDGEGEGEGERK